MMPTDLPNAVTAPPAPILFERDAVLSELNVLLASLAAGHGRMVAMSGEAGMGKTSVLRAFSQMANERFIVLRGGCEDLMAPRPLGPLFDMADVLDADLLDMLSDEKQQGQVMNHLLIAIQRSRTPMVMIIEDIHWADDATLDLVKFLGRRAATLPLLLVVSHRDDEPGRGYSIGRILGSIPAQDIERIPLQPLSAEAVTRMAQNAGRDTGDIHGITCGNPFFVTEILASRPGSIIPHSVRDAVWARFERCTIEQRVALEALSIVPGGAETTLLKSLLTEPQAEQLDTLIDSGMLTLNGDMIRFRHELARQSVFQLVQENRKRNLHQAASDWLGQQGEAQDVPMLARRIHHANAACDAATVVNLAPDVARRAAKMGAHKQAAQFLALALVHVDTLPDAEAAQLHESWSYESGLSEQISDAVIAARHRAIELWQKVGHVEKIGLNYRWLSRLHWYRGEADEAKHYIDAAVEILETIAPGPELAWSYSVRSQWAMLNDQFEDSLLWGERAKALAKRFNETEIYVHALNNMGTSLLLSTDPVKGRALMDESLKLALEHEFHEQAARVYTNMAEYALAERDLDLAKQYLEDGIAFDTEYDLDSWLHYLRGCHARYLMMRGDLTAADALARDVLEIPNQTLLMQLPASTVLAHIAVRQGKPNAQQDLLDLLNCAIGTKEPQRIAPIHIALAEWAWLSGDDAQVRKYVDAALSAQHAVHPWDVGELICWGHRVGRIAEPSPTALPEPIMLECNDKLQNAADALEKIGMPFEEAIILCRMQNDSAIGRLDQINAIMQARKSASGSQKNGKRGRYTAARTHPAGLTLKEQQVLDLLQEGASNADIAKTMNRSIRTVEHHVSAVLGKLGVKSRNAIAPWSVEPGGLNH